MKSEVNNYLNMVYVNLGKIGHYCLDNGRLLVQKSIGESLDDIENGYEGIEQLATNSINEGNINTLKVANTLENGFDTICAKLDLELRYPFKERN